MPKVSVVIPCYNQGIYIEEAIESVLNQSYVNIEVIIVNDGSTDEYTNYLLKHYSKDKVKIIWTHNIGVSDARNLGIEHANGEYILPLDADDKIEPSYIEKGVVILENDPNVGIVYCKANLFGIKKGKWNLPEYSFEEILFSNMIFCSALFKKADWKLANGYKNNMKDGIEDHDFWLSLIELNRKVYRIPEYLFFYRIKNDSRTVKLEKGADLLLNMKINLFYNHQDIYIKNIKYLIKRLHDYQNEREKVRILLKIMNLINKYPLIKKIIKGLYHFIFKIINAWSVLFKT